MSGRGVSGSISGCQSEGTGSNPVVRSKKFRYFIWLDGELISEATWPVTEGDPKYLRRILWDANKRRGRR